MNKYLGVLGVLTFLSCAQPLFATPTTYYVDVANGSNGNTGLTATSAFLSISKASSVMVPGDTCEILTGAYVETVQPANSGSSGLPITYTNYEGDRVTIMGGAAISGSWSLVSGSCYSIPMSTSLGTGSDQVLVDGVMVPEVHWPIMSATNAQSTIISVPDYNYVTSGTVGGYNNLSMASGTIYDATLSQAANNALVGARVMVPTCGATPPWEVNGFETGTITASGVVSGTGYIAFSFLGVPYGSYSNADAVIPPGFPYYILGCSSLLGYNDEFCLSSGSLFLQTPTGDPPANHLVRMKQNQWAINLAGRSYINIENIGIIGAGVWTDQNTSHCTFNCISASYVFHSTNIDSIWNDYTTDSGIVLNGSDNTIENSSIAYSSANGISVQGTNQVVTQCTIHDADYVANDCAPIYMSGSGHSITRNTVYRMGRGGILHRNTSDATISQNLIHDFAEQSNDAGGSYAFETNGGGTIISQNIYRNGVGLYNDYIGGTWVAGPYLDNGCSNFTVADNLVYNMDDWGMMLNLPNSSMEVYNNTLAATGTSIVASGSAGSTMIGSTIANNIFTAPTALSATCTMLNNLPYTTPPGFSGTSNPPDGYELSSTSAAINYGTAIPPWTGTSGNISAGCFQYGQSPWWAGGRVFFTQFANTGFYSVNGSWVGNVTTSSTGVIIGGTAATATGTGVCLLPVALDIGGTGQDRITPYVCFGIYYTKARFNTCNNLRLTLTSNSGISYYDCDVSALGSGTTYIVEPLITGSQTFSGSGVDLTQVTSWSLSGGTASGIFNCTIGPVLVLPQ